MSLVRETIHLKAVEIIRTLTDGLDDLGQKYPVWDVLLKVTDGVLVFGFLQVMIGPVCVYLQKDKTADEDNGKDTNLC